MKFLAILPFVAVSLAAPACKPKGHHNHQAQAQDSTSKNETSPEGASFYNHLASNDTSNGSHSHSRHHRPTVFVTTVETVKGTPTATTTSPIDTPAVTPNPTPATTTTTTQSSETPSTTSTTSTDSPAPTSTGTPNDGGLDADASQFVQLHNAFRAKYGAGAVTWNNTLASFANDVASKCVFKHSGGPYGENLAAGTGSQYTIESGFNSWANEASQYNWNSPGFSGATGHFTQVVWKATSQIGCAAVTCADGTIFKGYGTSLNVVCEYRAPGNVGGGDGGVQYYKENVGTLQA